MLLRNLTPGDNTTFVYKSLNLYFVLYWLYIISHLFKNQSNVRPSGVDVFKTLKHRDRWADVDETGHVYSMRLATEREAEFWISPHAQRIATPNLARLGEMIHPERGTYYW